MSYRAIRRVLTAYETWAADRGLVPDGGRPQIQVLLEARSDYLEKRDPVYWRSGDVHELLIQYCAPRQVDVWDLAIQAPTAIRNFLRFLDETGRLHPGSTRVSTLIKELDRLTPKFADAMADTSRWRLAKRVTTAMVADGVDLADDSQVDDWAKKFNTLDAQARRPVLGELMDEEPALGTGLMVVHDGQVAFLRPGREPCKHQMWPDARCVCGQCPDGAYPAIQLPSEAELAGAVAGYGSRLLRRLAEFADWIRAKDRPVDKHGELMRDAVREAVSVFGLTPADATRLNQLPGLARLWRLSLEFGIVELRRTSVIPGPAKDLVDAALRGDAAPDEALALWCGLFDEVSAPLQGDGDDVLRDWLAPWPTHFLDHLYARSGQGELVSFAEIMREVTDKLADRVPPTDHEYFTELASTTTRLTLSYVTEHGGAEVSGAASPPNPPSEGTMAHLRSLGLETWTFLPGAGLRVRLTDLGRYAMRQQLMSAGATAPLAEIAAAPQS